MNNKKNKKIEKYMSLYMSVGMCFGVTFGIIYGSYFFPDNKAMGMAFGIPIGMCIGMAIGAEKDKRLSKNMMEVSRIEAIPDSPDFLIYGINKNGEEKEYKVSAKQMKTEKFSVEDRIAEEKDGSLVSLESK